MGADFTCRQILTWCLQTPVGWRCITLASYLRHAQLSPRYIHTGWLGMKHQVTYLHTEFGWLHNCNRRDCATDSFFNFSETKWPFDRGVASSFMRKESLSSLPSVFVLRYGDLYSPMEKSLTYSMWRVGTLWDHGGHRWVIERSWGDQRGWCGIMGDVVESGGTLWDHGGTLWDHGEHCGIMGLCGIMGNIVGSWDIVGSWGTLWDHGGCCRIKEDIMGSWGMLWNQGGYYGIKECIVRWCEMWDWGGYGGLIGGHCEVIGGHCEVTGGHCEMMGDVVGSWRMWWDHWRTLWDHWRTLRDHWGHNVGSCFLSEPGHPKDQPVFKPTV